MEKVLQMKMLLATVVLSMGLLNSLPGEPALLSFFGIVLLTAGAATRRDTCVATTARD
jgi:hypothetical protein